jgi:hypothetical protein
VSETGEVGAVDLQFDLTGIADLASLATCDIALSVRLLVDTDNDGVFNDQTAISGATNIGGNIYRFTNISAISNNMRFTVAISLPTYNGPGGVGGVSMWWRADTGVTTSGSEITTWADQSGSGNNLTGPAGFRPVAATSAALNNQPVVRYSGAQYFTSGFSGPGGDNLTLFMAANGTNYQSLFRFQNSAGTFVVYPWGLGGNTFISSSDGGTGGGIASGLVSSVNNVGGVRYRRNTANGMQTYLNGEINAQRASGNNA